MLSKYEIAGWPSGPKANDVCGPTSPALSTVVTCHGRASPVAEMAEDSPGVECIAAPTVGEGHNVAFAFGFDGGVVFLVG